ncbi:asparagine synthase (glutamine-hydrolyzing) [Pseudonocardia asaccharolytica]|uniref:asparagine synthase (glutamine-hydrolyzing) n=1 Tax=Pseudonocardia asaccharolytica TaxID=54010 RepID=UPI0004048069|nr:asparagine synthase (glutamine-hydrolyzing) [Pseudonocardia asaccharolytica]
MCGLLGLLTAGADAADRAEPINSISAALRCMRHRGPDESGTWNDADVVFGFNRLSIIDVDRSHQPLHWTPGPGQDVRYTIVFNGEIYNYLELRAELAQRHGARFTTHGDTEAIVAAYHHWGPAAVSRLRGMFSFLIWDAQERVLFGARDPFGIKPLFLATGPAGTAFASEKKSLLALAPSLGLTSDLDPAALQHYLLLQYVPEPATLHRAIRRVESGTHVTLRPGGEVEHERYFTPTFRAGSGSGAGVHARIAGALRDSVAKHMRADVTVGAFLSGGIDSTAIAALAKEHNPDLITFTTGFEREGYSEVDVAAESAAAIGVRHVVRTVKADEMMDALPLIVWYLDDPVADPALVPLWFIAREARQHVKVVLSGEGADELFGGYTIYREPLSLAPFERMPGSLRGLLGRASTRLPDGMRGKDLLRRGALSLEQRYYGNARIFRDDQLAGVLRQYDPRRSHTDITAAHYADSAGWDDPVARMQHVDLFTWLRGDILVKADKMTMANSLELRVPFLDPEVFAVASGLPLAEKLTGSDRNGTTKYALRRALAGIVPGHVLNRRKLGFPVPIRLWLREEMYPWARDIIRDSQADHLVDLAAVQRMLDAHREGPIDHSRRIWTLLVFLLWHGIFVEQRIRPEIPAPIYPVKL